MSGRLAGRIALVTGASRGIGAAVAKAYAAEGAQLVLLARTVGGLEATDDAIQKLGAPPAVLVPCDLTKFEEIDQLGGALFQRFGHLDVLVGNAAALGALGPVAQSDPAKFESTLRLNLSANYRLIRSLDRLLRASNAGRAIFVTSGVTTEVCDNWGAYAISKVALEYMVSLYAAESAHTKVKAYTIDPGAVRTRMRAQAMPGEDPEQLPAPEAITDVFVKLASDAMMATGEVFRAYDHYTH